MTLPHFLAAIPRASDRSCLRQALCRKFGYRREVSLLRSEEGSRGTQQPKWQALLRPGAVVRTTSVVGSLVRAPRDPSPLVGKGSPLLLLALPPIGLRP